MLRVQGVSFLLIVTCLVQCSIGFKYEIANILMVRLWPQQDPALENFGRLCEWLEYNIAIGVQHFYIYDDAHSNAEAFGDNPVLKTYIADGYVTYHRLQTGRVQPWSNWRQDSTYAEALRNYRNDVKWLLWIDMDEFVKLEKDKSLQDFIERKLPGGLRGNNTAISQFLFRSWFVSGAQASPGDNELRLIEQYLWRENEPWEVSNGRTKLLTIASEITGFVNVHKAIMRTGSTQEVALTDGFFLHYWKLRSQKIEPTDVHYYTTFAEEWGNHLYRMLVQRARRANVPLESLSAGPFPTLEQQKSFDPERMPIANDRTKLSSKKHLATLLESISRLRSRRG